MKEKGGIYFYWYFFAFGKARGAVCS